MKNLLLPALAVLLFVSCSKKAETDSSQTTAETNIMLEEPKPVDSTKLATSAPASPEAEGLKLIEGTDCLSCHKIDAKLVGPSYQDVAAKYSEPDIDMLAQKIIEGGKGNWGDIPMTPHSGMSKENAKLMVKYILSLKKS